MIEAKTADKALVVHLLCQSFEKNQSVNYIIRQDEKRLNRIRALMEYSFDVCNLFGEIWLSEDRKGCALILFPQLKRTTVETIWLDVKLIFKAIGLGRIKKALQREEKIKKLQPKGNSIYLWFIGVDPNYQHSGIGSKLLKEVLKEANGKVLPVYLETSTLQNLPWYEHFGCEI